MEKKQTGHTLDFGWSNCQRSESNE